MSRAMTTLSRVEYLKTLSADFTIDISLRFTSDASVFSKIGMIGDCVYSSDIYLLFKCWATKKKSYCLHFAFLQEFVSEYSQ